MLKQRILQAGMLLASILVAISYANTAMAHGKVSMEEDKCMRRIGDNIIHFSAYQPQVEKSSQYCTEIPQAGETVLVVDLVDPVLRDMPISVKVIQGKNEESGNLVSNIQAKEYVDGVINTQTFLDKGEYNVVVTAEGVPPLKYVYDLRVDMVSHANLFRSLIGPFMALLFLSIIGYKLMKSKRVQGWFNSKKS